MSLNVNENSYEFAMNFLLRNYSDKQNKIEFSDVCEVPFSVTGGAMVPLAYVPPENIVFFQVGNFS